MSAFLEIVAAVTSLTIRATTKSVLNFAPAVFLQAHVLLGCDFYYSAEKLQNSTILAARLLAHITVANCNIYSCFITPGEYGTVLLWGGHAVTGRNNNVDIDRANSDEWLKGEKTAIVRE